jgi:beta-aspartyl-peptidase (threonine type)
MEQLPHVLLVGEGAACFAREIHAEPRDMLSPEARAKWLARLREWGVWPAGLDPALPVAQLREQLLAQRPSLTELTRRAVCQDDGHDTMIVIVRDAAGNLASAVTTSGVPWKHPGRCGDSPLIGAGNYADNRHGAAACLGWGEAAIRVGAARLAVACLQAGHSLAQAGNRVVQELRSVCTGDQSVRVLLMDPQGTPAGFATHPGFACKVHAPHHDAPRTIEMGSGCKS